MTGIVVLLYDLSTLAVKEEGSEIQYQFLHSEFEVILGDMRLTQNNNCIIYKEALSVSDFSGWEQHFF